MSNTTKKKPKTGLSRLLELAATKKGFTLASITFSALASVVSFIPYLAIYKIVSIILAELHNLSAIDTNQAVFYGWVAFAGVVGQILLYFIALMFSHLGAFGTLYELKVNFASHLAKLPLGFHVLIGSGKLRKIMDQNIEDVEGFIAHQLPDIVAAFVAPVVMIGILIYVDWRLGLAALVGVILAFVMQMALYGNETSKSMMNKYQASIEDMNNAAVEYVRGISVVKAFKQTVYSFRRLHDTIKAYTSMVIPYTLSWKYSYTGFVTLVNNIYLFVVPIGIFIGASASDLGVFIPKFIFYMVFVPSIASILMKVMYVNSSSMKIAGGVEAMDHILAEEPLPQPTTPKTVDSFELIFHNVGFAYNKDAEALKNVSFVAKQGQTTAIVGPSGGGKSTIAHLIPRFFDVSAGSITLGGVDIKEMQSSYLMKQVSFVFQDVFLFKQSVLDNIRMGNEKASKEQVVAAAKAAQCHDFIMALPNGYETVIGTRGVHLSGGEQQRIAIARAIVKDAPVVVLDEATAFSDPENEHLIQKAFETLMENKTVVMIAHRLSTIRSADKIVVINDGSVTEEGTHESLLEKQGQYSNMWRVYNETISWKMETKEVEVNV